MGFVMIEGLPAAHVGCTVICTGVISAGIVHPPPPPPPAPPPPIVKGSLTVLIHGMPAARWAPSGDIGACGGFLGDPKLVAMRTGLIGGLGRGGPPSRGGPTPPFLDSFLHSVRATTRAANAFFRARAVP